MPTDPHIVPSDYLLVQRARKRGGEQAAARMAELLAKRVVVTCSNKDKIIAALMADDQDHAWPPAFVKGTK